MVQQALKDGKGKGARLTRTGLGETNNITACLVWLLLLMMIMLMLV